MPAAIAVPLIVGGVSAASSLIGGKMQSSAAKKAAGLQTASQDKAQAFNQRAYDDQRAALNPYVQAGNASLDRLMQQHWGKGGLSPGMMGTAAPQGQYVTPGSGYQAPAPGLMAPGMGGSPLAQAMGGGGPQRMPGPMAQPTGQQAMPRPAGPSTQGGGMVTLRAPDGAVSSVPEAMAQQFLARGATRIG